jgi:uncharacterized protein (TIGR03083 family)
MTDRPVVAHLVAVWSSVDGLLAGLDDKDWDRPTDCPGWSVRDQVSHLIGTESRLLGRPSPPPVDQASHVHNPLGLANEAWVHERRGRPGSAVLAEFREVTAARTHALRAMTDEQFAAETDGPVGRMPYGSFMEIRVMDCWVHEQDIRRAVGRVGHLEGPAAAAAVGRFTASLGFVVAKKAGAPDGTTVVARLGGTLPRTVAIEVVGGKGRPLDPPPLEPSVTLAMSAETYACLSSGRWSPHDAVSDGRVQIEGDQALANRILGAMAIIP